MARPLPKFVCSYRDRHGNMRFRFRKKDVLDVAMPDILSPEFASAYDACMEKVGAKSAPLRLLPLKPCRGVSYVYFVGSEKGPVKIGLSIDLPSRVSRLRVSHHTELHLLAFQPGDRTLEVQYHQRFAAQRLAGEWFTRSRELNNEIYRVRRLQMSNQMSNQI